MGAQAVTLLAFDIETVPDFEGGARLYGLQGLPPADIAKAMAQKRLQEAGTEFMRHHLHRVVAISVAMRSGEQFRVWSLGSEGSGEAELLARFFDGLERFSPQLVSWNGSGFDLPVLHYRALIHGVSAPRYWETGEEDNTFRWNNYLNRYHARHTDLMDVLSAYQPRAAASLDEVAVLCGLPGKLDLDGAAVWDRYLDGDLAAIRAYCEGDVLNTYLLYLRYDLMRGRLDERGHARECDRVREALRESGAPHLRRFLERWEAGGRSPAGERGGEGEPRAPAQGEPGPPEGAA